MSQPIYFDSNEVLVGDFEPAALQDLTAEGDKSITNSPGILPLISSTLFLYCARISCALFVGNNVSLESDSFRNILEDESANSGVDGKTTQNEKDGTTDASTREMRHVQEEISIEIDKHDVAINIPANRKSYADIVRPEFLVELN